MFSKYRRHHENEIALSGVRSSLLTCFVGRRQRGPRTAGLLSSLARLCGISSTIYRGLQPPKAALSLGITTDAYCRYRDGDRCHFFRCAMVMTTMIVIIVIRAGDQQRFDPIQLCDGHLFAAMCFALTYP